MRRLMAVFITLNLLVLPLAFAFLLWLALPSGQLLRIEDVEYDKASDVMTIHRTLTNGTVLARWHMAVSSDSTGQECSVTREDVLEAESPDGSTKRSSSFPAPEDLRPCLDQPDAAIVADWQVLLLRVLPLRPVFFSKSSRRIEPL